MSHYRIVNTAFGYAVAAFEPDPFRLLEIRLPQADLKAASQPFDEQLWQIDREHSQATIVAQDLIGYFNGKAIDIPWQWMDLSRFTPSQQAVYQAVAGIPYGETASYGQVAKMAGLPRAARFVGTTMANNPYPVLIPCHRVIRSDGSAGLFGGGEALKIRMLAMEAAGRK
ncbi:MGMT family protein [uncultured Desulfosarcina sp.]|uniref:methylated-DNA--[protein]-cysteine S-methyltransferase n=1 Tax=uncultured Desulfosarcina sp. TaxID=218289 RepID=UPI0029C7C7B9|nr:MGMT family protein [uncultured Desulfosarcina sp.]